MNGTILNLGPLEVLVIIILALLVLGPERLPGIMRGIGTTLRRLRETYVAFVNEFRNELQPIAEEVDTVTREIQGELAAIRDAVDIRSVLTPVAQDINDASRLDGAASKSGPPTGVEAPDWGILGAAQNTAPDVAQDVVEAPLPIEAPVVEAPPPARPMTVEEAILGPARAAQAEQAAAAATAAATAAKPKPFSIDEPQPVVDTRAASEQYHRTMLMAEFSRTRVELKGDNPWASIELPIRRDDLDEDSPWRG